MADSQLDAIAAIKPVPAAVQLLRKQLTSDDPGVRKAGVDSIPNLTTTAEPLMDLLSELMTHQNWFVRESAADGCAVAAGCDAYWRIVCEDIICPFMRNQDESIRRMAQKSVLAMVATADVPDPPPGFPPTKPGCAEDVANLVVVDTSTLLSSDDALIRLNGVGTLGRIGNRSSPYASSLGSLIADPDVSVRNAVIRCFQDLGPATIGGMEMASKMLVHQDAVIRKTARRALVALREHSGEAACAAVASQLSTQDTATKRFILEILAEFGELIVPHGQALVDLLTYPEMSIRNVAVRVMLEAGPEMSKYVKPIMALLKHSEPSIRRIAVDAMRALAPISEPFAETVGLILQDGMAEATGDINAQRIQILDILGGAKANAKPYLSDIVRELEAPDWSVRRAAIEAIQDLEDHAEAIAGEVARRLLHFDPDIRRAAGEALGAMGVHATRYAHRLLATLDSEEDEDAKRTLQQAADALVACGALTEEDQMSRGDDSPKSPKARKDSK